MPLTALFLNKKADKLTFIGFLLPHLGRLYKFTWRQASQQQVQQQLQLRQQPPRLGP